MLAQFKHDNVMGLLGVVTMSEPIMVILHYMPYGDLKTYLHRYGSMIDDSYNLCCNCIDGY